MDFILTIHGKQGQSLIRFLQGLDFVQLRPANTHGNEEKGEEKPAPPYPYFGACPDWDIDADDLRAQVWPNRAA